MWLLFKSQPLFSSLLFSSDIFVVICVFVTSDRLMINSSYLHHTIYSSQLSQPRFNHNPTSISTDIWFDMEITYLCKPSHPYKLSSISPEPQMNNWTWTDHNNRKNKITKQNTNNTKNNNNNNNKNNNNKNSSATDLILTKIRSSVSWTNNNNN